MNQGKLLRRCICVCTALLLFITAVGTVFAGNISDAQKEKESLKSQLSEAQALIEELRDSKEDIQGKIAQLDAKLTEISQRISELELSLSQKETEITDTQQELLAAQQDVEVQYESMKVRIRFMYENSSQSYLTTLLSSENLTDFLNRAEYIYQVSQYDRAMLKRYEDTVASVSQMETTLQKEKEELAQLANQVQEEQTAVSALLEEKENQLAQVGEDISDAQKLAQIYEAEIQAQDEIIAMIQAEEARKQEEARKAEEEKKKKAEEEARKKAEEKAKQEEAQKAENSGQDQDTTEGSDSQEDSGEGTGSDSNDSSGVEDEEETPEESEPSYNGGAFTWPCPSSTRVTSDYGPRNAPTGGASTYHKGLDIGAAYGADIVAAAAGTVSFAGYSNAAGNYVTISHGNGVYTVYMHCSSLCVDKGQNVSAGQVIAKVGSTGISTGNHLHFGVSLNGSYVNPWDYLK